MSKTLARGPESYANEERNFAKAVKVVMSNGFRDVTRRKIGSVKLIDAESKDRSRVSFWLKIGWAKVPFAAIQFGLFSGKDGDQISNAEFVAFVNARVKRMKARGVTHALLVHQDDIAIAVTVDDIASIYAEQMRRFPISARNTKSPTMWFFDPRPIAKDGLAAIVWRRAIPLSVLAERANARPEEPEARSRIAQIEARVAQVIFRLRVGERCGWRCVVTGSTIREALDAAHLPGKDWRKHNQAGDGILLRADIHRLVDHGLANIVDGCFRVSKAAKEEYGEYHNRAVM